MIAHKPLTVATSIVVLFFLLLASTSNVVAMGGLDATSSSDLEAFLDEIIHEQMNEVGIVGVTVSVVSGGEVVISKGYGYAAWPEKSP